MRQTLSRSTFVGGLGCAAAVSAGARAKAADFPDRPITIVIPFDPGGAVDQLARLIDELHPHGLRA